MAKPRVGAFMRKPADWMVRADERILEVLLDNGNLTPIAISREGKVERAPLSSSYTARRCSLLHNYGLISEVDNNLYAISSLGMQFLAGEIDGDDLEPTNVYEDSDEGNDESGDDED